MHTEDPRPFWQRKTLAQMSPEEWESLCDGCGLCCLQKLEDEDDGVVYFTDVACKLLDLNSCQCSNYPERRRHVPDCVSLDAETVAAIGWLPRTCAYRLVSEGKPLRRWCAVIGMPSMRRAFRGQDGWSARPQSRRKPGRTGSSSARVPEPQLPASRCNSDAGTGCQLDSSPRAAAKRSRRCHLRRNSAV